MSAPKKHHYVPQFLLQLFADDRGRLLIYRTDRVASYPSNVRDVGHTNLGHSLYWPSLEPDHVTLERGMSEIEGAAAEVIKTLRGTTARTVSESQREVLGFLISLQWARSRFLLTTVRRSVTGVVPVDDSNRSAGLLPILTNVLGPWWARARDEFDPKERFSYVVDWLQHEPWTWRLYRPTSARLVVADNLVCMWGVADGETSDMPTAWTHHGIALGFGNCARITMPLAPELGLIIAREPYRNRRLSASDFNGATVSTQESSSRSTPTVSLTTRCTERWPTTSRRSAGSFRSSGGPRSVPLTRKPANWPPYPIRLAPLTVSTAHHEHDAAPRQCHRR